MAPLEFGLEFGTAAQDELEQRGDTVLFKQWELLHHCCAENTQQVQMLKRMVNELAKAVDEESSLRQADFQNLRETVHAEVRAHSEISGLEETLQGLVQDRVGKLEELLRAAIDKYDIEFAAERNARGAFATEVQDMLESKVSLQGQLLELRLDRDMAMLTAEFDQRQAKLAGEMQEFAAAMQQALELHKASIEEHFCTDKATHDSQVREIQSIKDFLADETDARQQQYQALEAAREQLQGHITRIVEDFGALREDKVAASTDVSPQQTTGQHCTEVQQEAFQPAFHANTDEKGRAATMDDMAPAVEAYPPSAAGHTWVQIRPGGWARATLPAQASQPPRPLSPRCSSPCSSPRSYCRTMTRVTRPASVPPIDTAATRGVQQAELQQPQQQQQQQQQQSPRHMQQVQPQLPTFQLSQMRSPKLHQTQVATGWSPDHLDKEGSLEGVSSASGRLPRLLGSPTVEPFAATRRTR